MKTVVGMFETRSEAEDAIHRLQAAGFGRESIGVAMRDHRESGDLAETTGSNDLAAEGATAGGLTGAATGALVGIALVGSTILLPGIGTVLIGGPLAAGLTGAAIGAASGGLIGGLVGAGIPEDEASEYSSRLERGHILVSVQAADNDVARARQILLEEGAGPPEPLPERPWVRKRRRLRPKSLNRRLFAERSRRSPQAAGSVAKPCWTRWTLPS